MLLAGADGITLGGKGIVLRGATTTNSIFKNSQTGGRQFFADENMTATNVVIADNPGSHIASRASKSVHSAVATGAQVKSNDAFAGDIFAFLHRSMRTNHLLPRQARWRDKHNNC